MSKWLFWPSQSAGYPANPVNFDGTNDYLTRGAALTGAADSKLLTASLWVRRAASGVTHSILRGAAFGNISLRSDNARLQFVFVEAGTSTVRLQISTNALSNTVWYNVLMSVDMANAANRHVYKNDVSDIVVTTYTDAILDLTQTNWAVGATTAAAEKFNGDLADLQIWFGTYVDFSITANRRLFVTATGEPVDPAIAEAALGEPIIQLTGATADWHTNKGTGGGFVENGAITDGSSPVEF